jgi:hypothetical protein
VCGQDEPHSELREQRGDLRCRDARITQRGQCVEQRLAVRSPVERGGAACGDEPAGLALVLGEVDEVEPGGEGTRHDAHVLGGQLTQQRPELRRVPSAAMRDGQRSDAFHEREPFGAVDGGDRTPEQVTEEADLCRRRVASTGVRHLVSCRARPR